MTDPSALILSQGPIAFWKMNEASGTTAADSIGSRTATAMNGLTMGGGAAKWTDPTPLLDGVDDYFQLSASSILMGLTDWTILAYARTNSSTDQTIYSERGASGNPLLRFSITSTGKLRAQYRDDAGNLTDLQVSGGWASPLTSGLGQPMAMRKQGTKLTLCLLGGEYDSITLTAGTGAITTTGVDARAGLDRAAGQPFNGRLFYLQLYNRALTTKEMWDQHVVAQTPTGGYPRQWARGRFPGGPRSIWNQVLEDSAPLHANSANFITEFQRLLGAYSYAIDSNQGYGVPVNRGFGAPRKSVVLHNSAPYPSLQTQFNFVEIPPNLGIATGTDEHSCVDDYLNDEYWETWLTTHNVTWATGTPTFTINGTAGTIPAGTWRYHVVPYTNAYGTDIANRGGVILTTTTAGSSVTLNWTPQGGADGYKIFVRNDTTGGLMGLLATVAGGNIGTFTDNGSLWPANFTSPPAFDITGTFTPFSDPNVVHADYGGVMRGVSSSLGYFSGSDNLRGASATSLPIWGGLITAEELVAGGRGELDAIQHALAMAVPISEGSTSFFFPAQRTDASNGAANAIRAGTRFRLSPAVDVSSLSMAPLGKAIARAFQRFGGYVRDISGGVTIAYCEDTHDITSLPFNAAGLGKYDIGSWTTPFVLAGMPWSSFQVVDPSYTLARTVASTRARRR